jgi:protein-disulfide isomerase
MRGEETREKGNRKLTVPVNIGSDHIRGSINAPITLVKYGDYECPYTDMAYPIIKEIMKQFGDKIYMYFATSPSMTYILMLSTQQKQLKLLQPKTNPGKCMIICLNIRKH